MPNKKTKKKSNGIKAYLVDLLLHMVVIYPVLIILFLDNTSVFTWGFEMIFDIIKVFIISVVLLIAEIIVEKLWKKNG